MKRAIPPPPTPIRRPPQTLGIVSALDSRQGKVASVPLPFNRSSMFSAIEPRHQGTPAVSTKPMSSCFPPGAPRRPPIRMEHQTQSRVPRPSAQIMRQSPLPQNGTGWRTGTAMGNTNGTTQGRNSTGRTAPRVAGLNALLKPSERSMKGSGSALR